SGSRATWLGAVHDMVVGARRPVPRPDRGAPRAHRPAADHRRAHRLRRPPDRAARRPRHVDAARGPPPGQVAGRDAVRPASVRHDEPGVPQGDRGQWRRTGRAGRRRLPVLGADRLSTGSVPELEPTVSAAESAFYTPFGLVVWIAKLCRWPVARRSLILSASRT